LICGFDIEDDGAHEAVVYQMHFGCIKHFLPLFVREGTKERVGPVFTLQKKPTLPSKLRGRSLRPSLKKRGRDCNKKRAAEVRLCTSAACRQRLVGAALVRAGGGEAGFCAA
jgi:hypothetical protein